PKPLAQGRHAQSTRILHPTSASDIPPRSAGITSSAYKLPASTPLSTSIFTIIFDIVSNINSSSKSNQPNYKMSPTPSITKQPILASTPPPNRGCSSTFFPRFHPSRRAYLL